MTSPLKSIAQRIRSWFTPRKQQPIRHRARLLIDQLEDRAVPAAGALDASFSGDGKVITDIGFELPSNDYGQAVVVYQPDGKILVGGYSQTDYAAGGNVVRYNADGTLDSSFGESGRVVLASTQVRTLGLQTDGKILAVGERLARLNTDGSLDTSFGGGDGIADTPFFAQGMVVQSDGKFVIGGGLWGGTASITYGSNQSYTYGHSDFALARYNADGTLDTSFDGVGDAGNDGDGVRRYDFGGGSESGSSLALGPNDTLVLAGQRGLPTGTATGVNWTYSWAVARFAADGTPDTSFSGDGLQTLFSHVNWMNAQAVAVQADGKVVLTGYRYGYSDDFLVARLNADGTPDVAFDGAGDPGGDGDGAFRTDFGGSYDSATSVLIDANGKIVVAGVANMGATSYDFALARFNTDGTPDTSFDVDGKLTTDFGSTHDQAYAAAAAPDGKLVVAGFSYQPTGGYYSADIALARYDSAGALDTSFSGDGKATTDVGLQATSNDFAQAVAVQQPDGKVLVGGYSYGPLGGAGTVVRYNADGTLDMGFGQDGLVVLNNNSVRSLQLLADGKILVGGDRLARLNANGSLDTSFGGGDGIADYSPFYPSGMVVQSDGKIVIGGSIYRGQRSLTYGSNFAWYYSDYDFGLARYNADGTLDTSFDGAGDTGGDGDGVRSVDFGGYSVDYTAMLALGPNDTLVLAGQRIVYAGTATTVTSTSSWAVAQFAGDGTPDTSFSGDGLQTLFSGTNYAYARAVAVQTDGKVVLTGESYGYSGDFLLARLNADGTPDVAFDGVGDPGSDGDGVFRTDFGGGYDSATSVLIDANGKIVVAGTAYMGATGNDFALARYNADGSPDTDFSGDGKQTTDFASPYDVALAVTVAPGGKLVAAGYSYQNTLLMSWYDYYPYDLALARYDSTGALDTSFSGDGKVTTELGVGTKVSSSDFGYTVAVQQPDGKVLVGGYSYAYYQGGTVVRYNADGTLDTGFGQGGLVILNNTAVRSLRLLADGKILVAGGQLARLNADGSLDVSFGGGDGISEATPFWAESMVVQSDGKIVIGGSIYNDFALARYNADGTLDTSFDGAGDAGGDGDGVRSVDFGDQSADYASTLALGLNDTLVLAGQRIVYTGTATGYSWAAARFTADGALDTSFSGDGLQTGPNSSWAQAAVVQSDGKVVLVGGYDYDNTGDFLVVRLNADGTPDVAFDGAGDPGGDGDGAFRTDFGGDYDYASSVLIDASGRIVVAGQAYMGATGYDFALARYNADGTADNYFDSDGKVTTDFGSTYDQAIGMAIAPGGKLVVAGFSYQPNGGLYSSSYPYDFVVARYIGISDPKPSITDAPTMSPEGTQIGFGSTVTDGSGTPTYSWCVTKDGNPYTLPAGTVTNGANFAFTPTDNGSYVVKLTVMDTGGTGSDSKTITVNNVDPTTPADINAAANQVVENAANGTVVGVTAASTDPGVLDTVTYSLLDDAGGRFAIHSTTGVVTVLNGSLLDYESATSHDITVQASDGQGGTSSESFTINLTNVTAVISGTVFVDVDGDGLFDGGTETGIDGVTVELLNDTGGFLANNVTELGGVYAFTVNDELGTYRIREIQPTGVTDGAAILGSAVVDSVFSANEMQLTLASVNASDYDFTEVGSSVQAGDTAGIGFWQNKNGQALINQGGAALVNWLNANFANVFGTTFSNGSGGDNAAEVASFYKNEFFMKKLQGTSKVDAQFMATALAAFFTSSNLSGGSVAAAYGFNVTDTGIGTKVVNVGSSGAAFGVANNTDMTIMALLLATNSLTGADANGDGYSNAYDTNGDGVLDDAEKALRALANTIYSEINEDGDI